MKELHLCVQQVPATGHCFHDLLRLVITETTEALGSDVCSVYLVDPADGCLVLTATTGPEVMKLTSSPKKGRSRCSP